MGRQSLRTRATRSQTTASLVTEGRADAIGQMNTQLRQKFTRIEEAVNDMRAQNLRFYHHLGEICHEISEDPGKYVGQDGTPALTLIERALSTHARTLRAATEFSRKYTVAQLEYLIGLYNRETNYQLNWGHAVYLLTLPTEARRQSFAEEAVAKMLDPKALHDLIKRRTGRTGGHGRRHEMPKTIGAQIRQVNTESEKWLRKNNEVWTGAGESVFGNILSLPLDKMEPEMVEQLEDIGGLMARIADAATENIGRVERAKEYIETAIQERADEVAAAIAEEAAQAQAIPGRQSREIDLSTTR